MAALHGDVDVEVGDGVVKVDDVLYFAGTECKYCRDESNCVVVVDDDRVGPHFAVCDTHREMLEDSGKDAKFYEITTDD